MPGLFVTATGTGVGKTFVTCGLLRAGLRAGLAMDALKPILTGYAAGDAARSDAGRLLAALGRPIDPAAVARIAPFRFAAPLSPNMAAALEGRALDFDAVVASCRAALRPDRFTLIEGIGGVMVPFDLGHTVRDLVAALGLPALLVGGTGLGALSHALTAYEALGARGTRIAALVLDETAGSTVSSAATRDTVAAFCAGVPITLVPQGAGDDTFDRLFGEIARSLEWP